MIKRGIYEKWYDKCDIFYKLCTFKDSRYDYRIKDLPASINPSSANMMLEEVRKYLKKDASVLDPFCGTSTMLIERSHTSSCCGQRAKSW